MISRHNSTLRVNPKKKMRTRTLEEKFGDDPGKYGILFREVRTFECFGITYLPGTACGLGYAPASAHHLGDRDIDGLLPVCGSHHSMLEEWTLEVAKTLREAGNPTLEDLGRHYLHRAIRNLEDRGEELPPELLSEARKKGVIH